MATLHGFPFSHNTRKVLALVRELDLDVTLQSVNLIAKETFTPAFKAMNPNGLAPVLVDGDFTLWESNAILVHLACSDPARRLWPAAPHQHMDIVRWLFWQSCHWDPGLDVIGLETFVRKLEGNGEPDPLELARGRKLVAKAAPVLDQQLATRRFICGEPYSIADFSIASSMMYFHLTDYPLDGYSHIWRWYKDLWASSPGWRASEPDWPAVGLPAQAL